MYYPSCYIYHMVIIFSKTLQFCYCYGNISFTIGIYFKAKQFWVKECALPNTSVFIYKRKLVLNTKVSFSTSERPLVMYKENFLYLPYIIKTFTSATIPAFKMWEIDRCIQYMPKFVVWMFREMLRIWILHIAHITAAQISKLTYMPGDHLSLFMLFKSPFSLLTL